jgi:hypothetical protein
MPLHTLAQRPPPPRQTPPLTNPRPDKPLSQPLEYEVEPITGLRRVRYNPAGWRFWDWRGFKVHYIEAGTANTVGTGIGLGAGKPELTSGCLAPVASKQRDRQH